MAAAVSDRECHWQCQLKQHFLLPLRGWNPRQRPKKDKDKDQGHGITAHDRHEVTSMAHGFHGIIPV